MEFSHFLPPAVRDWIATSLDGDGTRSWAGGGWRYALETSLAEVQRLEGLLQTIRDPEGLNNVRVELAAARGTAASLAENVSSLERLACREEMHGVFARLAAVLSSEREVTAFVRAAWVANMDYGRFRDQLKKAEEAASEVAQAACNLAKALEKAETVGTYLPLEMFSVRALLRATDHPPGDRNFAMWQGLRRSILGERDQPPPASSVEADPWPTKIVFVSLADAKPIGAEEEMRDTLQYAWGTAPRVRDLISSIQSAAARASPSEDGAIGAALASQKRNRKTEYLRSFGTLLRDQHQIPLSTDVMHAMAATATVMLNDAGTDVSYDDVRKAVKHG